MNCQRLIFLLCPFVCLLVAVAVSYGQEIKKNDASGGGDQQAASIRVPKQVGSSPGGTVQSGKDHEQAGGHHFDHHGHHGHGFGHGGHGLGHGGHHGDGKYFMYAHVPDYGTYEYGYRRGNDYHMQERYERGYGWNFKTKVKWGDKYGGYGEHYWDYNHADKSHGHDGGHGHGHGHDDGGHGHGHYSEQVPTYTNPGDGKVGKNKRQSKKQQQEGEQGEVKGEQEALIRPLRFRERSRPAAISSSQSQNQPTLTLNPVSGRVTDEATGKSYILKPAN